MKEKILLLHGALGSKEQFSSIKKILEGAFDVYDLNFEGHGGVASSRAFSIELFTNNVIDFLNKESIDRIHIFGYSMGGYVGLNIALIIPQKILKIVTLGTKFNWDIESTRREMKMLDTEAIEKKVPHFADKLREVHFPQDWKVIVHKTASMMEGLSQGFNLSDEKLMMVHQEVVIGIGSLDKMVNYEESKRVSELFANGKLRLLEGVEHAIDKTDPEKIASFVLESFK